ncbi:hypothetical protein D3C76_1056990 [compost metagenome]
MQVELRVGHQLVAVGALVRVTTLGVVGQLVDVGEQEVHALFMQVGALAIPVAEQEIVLRVAIGMGRLQGAEAQQAEPGQRGSCHGDVFPKLVLVVVIQFFQGVAGCRPLYRGRTRHIGVRSDSHQCYRHCLTISATSCWSRIGLG